MTRQSGRLGGCGSGSGSTSAERQCLYGASANTQPTGHRVINETYGLGTIREMSSCLASRVKVGQGGLIVFVLVGITITVVVTVGVIVGHPLAHRVAVAVTVGAGFVTTASTSRV
jgi:hypothetical protein